MPAAVRSYRRPSVRKLRFLRPKIGEQNIHDQRDSATGRRYEAQDGESGIAKQGWGSACTNPSTMICLR